MSSVSYKIASPIIITGIFIISVFMALNYQNLSAGFYAVFIFICIYVFLFGFAVGQNFSSPVKKLLKRATLLSQGDLTSRVYLETKDELGELSKIFNKIADELEESRVSIDKMEKTIDIKVKARTQSLEETIDALEQKVRNRTLQIEDITNQLDKCQEQTKIKDAELLQLKIEITGLKDLAANCQVKKGSLKKSKIKTTMETEN